MFVTFVSNLSSHKFLRQAFDALQLIGTIKKGEIAPFTYYHKGRPAKDAASVGSEQDFGLMLRAINTRNLDSINIQFLESELNALGISDKLGSTESNGSGGLASSTGVPRAEAMCPEEVDRAKLIGLLEARWRCTKKGHRFCYVADGIHGELTIPLLSVWAGFIHDHTATITEPPKLQMFDFAARQREINARNSFRDHPTLAAGSSDIAQVALPLLQQLISASIAGNSMVHTPATSPPPLATEATPSSHPQAPETLVSFLSYAEEEYGVKSANYKDDFARDNIGPDVMDDMEISELVRYGIPQGDIYRLKRAARAWEKEELGKPAGKRARHQREDTPPRAGPAPFQIAFDDKPPTLPVGHVRDDAERAGRPPPGRQGNFCWQKKYPGESEGGFTFWADMPSPTLDINDPLLAPHGTVQLRVASGHYIDVLRAPRPEILLNDDEENDRGF